MDEREHPDERREASDLPAAPPTRGRDQAIWVGLFLVLGLVTALAALFILTDAALFRGRYVVTTTVPNAGGIRRNDPVQMRGVNIGRIQRFKIDKESVDIRLELEGEYDVPADSHVELKSSGLLGGMIAEVVPGDSSERLKNGDRLPGSTEAGMFEAANRIAVQVEAVMGRVDRLLSTENLSHASATLANADAGSKDLRDLLTQLSKAVADERRELSTLTASLQKSAGGMERITTGPEMDRTLQRLDSLGQRMDTMAASFERSAKSMEEVTARVDRGEGTLGKMSRDDQLYRSLNEAAVNINQATANINKLTEDIKRDPKKYFKISVF